MPLRRKLCFLYILDVKYTPQECEYNDTILLYQNHECALTLFDWRYFLFKSDYVISLQMNDTRRIVTP